MKPVAFALLAYIALDLIIGCAVWKYLALPAVAALNAALKGTP